MIEDGEVRPEGCICEQFVYLSNLAIYQNSSDMNELGAIPIGEVKDE